MRTFLNKIIAIGLCAVLIGTSSCESFLEEEPKDFLSSFAFTFMHIQPNPQQRQNKRQNRLPQELSDKENN